MKRYYLLNFITIFFALSSVSAQTPPPTAGRYSCSATQITNSPFNLPGSFIIVPAAFGNIVMDGKGNYQLPSIKKRGLYKFDKTTSELSFTSGDLQLFKASGASTNNGTYRFRLTLEAIAYSCTLQGVTQGTGQGTTTGGAANPKPSPPAILNKGLKGNLLISTSNEFRSYPGIVYRIDLATGDFSKIFTDGVAHQSTRGDILYFDKESRIKITDKTGNLTVKQITDRTGYNFDDFYPAISNSGEYYALTMQNTNDTGIFAGIGTTGNKVLIFNRNGRQIAEFKGYAQAAWMPDNGLVVAGDGSSNRGLFIINPNLKTIKKLVEGFETAQLPAVSPDGKQVAFVKNDEIWTIGIDGTNPKVAIFGGVSSFPTWSPDGKYVAAVVRVVPPGQVISKNLIFAAKINTAEGLFLVDKANEPIPGGNRISWLTDVPITTPITANPAATRDPETTLDSITAYKPTQVNKDPNFTKAYELYTRVMGEDLDNYNDVAAAFTYVVVYNYALYHQLEGIPTNQVRQIYKNFVEKLSQTSRFIGSTNEIKQQLAELAILDGVETFIVSRSKDQVKIKEVTLRIMKKYVGKTADKLKITDNGIEF
jgi:Tol biopolymer transport system component